jgi:hypothetical protein
LFVFHFSAAEYGSVLCDGIPLADIPQDLQEGRVFKLHLRNNDLHRFPDAKLQGTGKGSSINDVTVLGGGVKDTATIMALVIRK